MSHSTAVFKFKDGTILHGEYNGTVDVMLPFMYNTEEERTNNWRRRDWKECINDNCIQEQIRVATSYGRGFSWNGIACRKCMVFIGPKQDFYDSNYENNLPDWYPNANLYR